MSSRFDAYYYKHGCGDPYQRNDTWLGVFRNIADKIIQDTHPKTVLDAGCAWGFLVESLRDKGVEAYGVDISDYAISQVHPSVKPYCWVGSITQPLPQRYDLIITIEVLEHLPPQQANQAIENLCQATDDIIFSSTPFDYKETTHFNVQMPEAWLEAFARHGFYRDVDFDASFLTPWAVRLRKKSEPFHRLIRDYERKMWPLYKENFDLRNLSQETDQQLRAQEEQILIQQNRILEIEEQMRVREAQWQEMMKTLEASSSWRLMKRLQSFREVIIPVNSSRERALHLLLKGKK